MTWLDRLMDKLTSRGTKMVASGHGPEDFQPETGSGELSEELEADFGPETAATQAPSDGAEPTDQDETA
jgi:hypothetical protein